MGKLARRASRSSPVFRKLTAQWPRASAQPIPLLQSITALSQISFFEAERKVICKKRIFDNNLDFEKFSLATAFVAFVKH